MVLHCCGYVAIGRYGVVVGYGDGSAEGRDAAQAVALYCIVAAGPRHCRSTTLAIVFLDALGEVVALNQELGVLAGIDAVAGTCAAEVVVQHVNLAYSSHWHALLAVSSPPVEGEGGVQIAFRLAVAAANEVGVLVHVGTAGISEGTPADGDEVRLAGDVEIAVLAINKCAVVYPAVLGACSRDKVVATHVDGTRTYEGNITNDDIVLVEAEDACIAITLVVVARQIDDNLASVVFSLLAYGLAVAQRATATAGTHAGHTSSIKGGLDFVCHIPLGAESCVVDAQQRFVASLETNIA